ncbi:uncharacterized protein [Temnothorax longispinosus]|uniref:uncharacterized protein n=1 Tax=Temnothorax longispinosus TaxID=300112 RepID=UPI003A991F87
MGPQGSQVTFIEKDFMLTEGDMLDQQLQDISNFTLAFTKNKNEECKEKLNKKNARMRYANLNRNKENIPNDNALNYKAVDEENYINLSLSILKSILSEIKEIKKKQAKILQKINNLENKQKSSKDIVRAVQQLNLPVQTVEQFQILIKDEKALSILPKANLPPTAKTSFTTTMSSHETSPAVKNVTTTKSAKLIKTMAQMKQRATSTPVAPVREATPSPDNRTSETEVYISLPSVDDNDEVPLDEIIQCTQPAVDNTPD